MFNLFNDVPVLRFYECVNRGYYLNARFTYTLGARTIRFAVRYSFKPGTKLSPGEDEFPGLFLPFLGDWAGVRGKG